MIKIEHVILPNADELKFTVEGMRNPMNSWDRSDSSNDLGENDYKLMKNLSYAGTEHRKFMRMMPVYIRVTAPLYWWKEFDTYKIGTVANSCSTMHKITSKEFSLDDFSCEHLYASAKEVLKLTIKSLNYYRELYINDKRQDKEFKKNLWWQMIQLLPSSYNQTRNIMLNFEVLANIYRQRKGHKLNEWNDFCKWIEELCYSDLITGGKND